MMSGSPDRLSEEHIRELRRLHDQDTGKVIPRPIFSAGQVMIEAGATGDNNSIFILLGGSVRVQREGDILAKLSGPGVFVGEIAALFPRTNRTATVIAQETVRALKLTPNDLAFLNGAGGELSEIHQIIRGTAVARVATMNPAEMQAAGFPVGTDLWGSDFDPVVLNPTRFYRRNIPELLAERQQARTKRALAEERRLQLMAKSPLYRAFAKAEERRTAGGQSDQNKQSTTLRSSRGF